MLQYIAKKHHHSGKIGRNGWQWNPRPPSPAPLPSESTKEAAMTGREKTDSEREKCIELVVITKTVKIEQLVHTK